MNLLPGRVNLLIDGQFGSTGKGLMASYIAERQSIDIAVSNASANAGHTAIMNTPRWLVPKCGFKVVCHHLPISGVFNDQALIYLCSGSIIDPDILLDEINRYRIDPERVKEIGRAHV